MLQAAGIDCGIDTTTTLSPGQKFRHWEERGVMVRVELGPQEALSGSCLLAICTTPGEVAAKSTVQVRASWHALPQRSTIIYVLYVPYVWQRIIGLSGLKLVRKPLGQLRLLQ